MVDYKWGDHWWDNTETAAMMLSECYSESDIPLIHMALFKGTTATHGKVEGRRKGSVAEFHEAIECLGFAKYYDGGSYHHFATPECLLRLSHSAELVTCFYCTSNRDSAGPLVEFLASTVDRIPLAAPKPAVYGFSKECNSIVVREIGTLDDVFERGNYAPAVVEQFDRVVAELKTHEPAGRLVLMEGQPGCGKTRAIRALIAELMSHGKCIIVPPSLLDELSGPNFVLTLIQERNRLVGTNKSLTLILEDADDCLIAREHNAAAKASLSALLNLSDGIMGAALDLRVVATTNQELGAIDRAILRPGRLLERIHVGALDRYHASDVFRRLTDGVRRDYSESTVLAQVYDDAREYMKGTGR